ncbi:NAD-dependent epimerase/dehydratase family protein [Aliiruegeria sabulilitoris]|uniref:NAD-dependent epimerase/dehydratase family protein n=1 Tax=Aliiruegeria sabulilitoris TaxID=1510458 RepID=UPI00082CA696|nr:NAD-dependent epimerase/dehydratase family protein [Aliiruegeria sabulilitoris]NDR56463.1 NAD-dependent epimerase/dehydratase family protein [Pseudoruegeria sp. M32A2M]
MDFLTDPFLVDPSRFDGPVLVTGAGGCIGSWVVSILAPSGVDLVAFDLRDDRTRPALLLGEAAAELIWETGDITDSARLAEICDAHGIRSIIHLAGLMVPFCKADPAAGARVNVEGTINVLELARRNRLKRLAYASSSAIHGMPPGGPTIATLYGAYKLANEHTAQVYWLDWQVPSVGIRPNVVYGVGRDLGMTSEFSVALLHAARGEAFDISFGGPVSWLYAGEAASAFIAAVAREGEGAPVFDLNGTCMSIEEGLEILSRVAPGHAVRTVGTLLPIPPDLSDAPIRAHLGAYPSVTPEEGIRTTFDAFQKLLAKGKLS